MLGGIHLNNVGLFTQGISLVTRTTSDSSRDRFVREFADLLPLAVGLPNGLVALSGTEALPEAIGQPPDARRYYDYSSPSGSA